MNPFDLKTALLAKHAQHVVLIHFPIALSMVSLAFDLLALWKDNRQLAIAAYYNLVASALPAVATGLLAWQWLYGGKKLRGNLRLHLLLGLASSTIIWLLCWWRSLQQRKPGSRLTSVYLAIELVAVALIALTGHLGGILSGVEAPIG
jgi:uncharacterized membrane protein